MKTNLILLSFLFIHFISKAQSNQIGITLSDFITSKSAESIPSISPLTKRDNNFKRINPYITFTHINKNHIMYSIQYAYMPYVSKYFSSDDREGNSALNQNEGYYKQYTHGIRLGLGKQNQWNDFSISSMIYVPISLSSKGKYKSSSIQTDSLNNITYRGESSQIYPRTFSCGIYLSQSISYKIYKHIYIGAECNIGMNFNRLSGNSEVYNYAEDHGNVIRNQAYSKPMKQQYTRLDFIPALSVSYSF